MAFIALFGWFSINDNPRKLNSTNIKFKEEITSELEFERISAKLEILSQEQEGLHPAPNQYKIEPFWKYINQQSEEFAEQNQIDKATELMEEELASFAIY